MSQPCFFNFQRFFFAITIGIALFFSADALAQTPPRQFLRGHVPKAVAHLQPTGRLAAAEHLHLAIGLPLRDQAALDRLIQQIYDPASPNFHHYLTSEQIAERFGPTEQDYQKVIAFARANNLTVTGKYPNRTLLDVSGSVADVERIFHVTMRTYRHPTEARMFYAPDVEPSVDLPVLVSHITGLNNFVVPRPMSLKITPLNHPAAVAPGNGSGPSGLYMGNDFRTAYVPGVTLDGSGQTIGLLELDGYHTNDITTYEADAGLPNIVLTNILIDSFSGTAGGNNVEVALDIEVAVAMATNLSQIIIYEGPNPGNPVDVLARMASDNLARQLSSSWLIGDDPNADVQYKLFAAQGQSFFQASGDDGAFFNGIQQATDDTNITLVGGTTLTTDGSGAWSSEKAWNWFNEGIGSSGTGGGISLNNLPIPSWQTNIDMSANNGSTTLRNIPDVALTADNIFIVADGGQQESVGGTSAAAPLWAAFAALMNQQAASAGRPMIGFVNPAVYAIAQGTNYVADFHDITTGNNTNLTVQNNFFAVPGYDLCTGWGTPVGESLITDLAGPPDDLEITPASGFAASGAISGPFTRESRDMSLTNSGATSITWTVANGAAWLNVLPAGGTLPSGGQTTVTVSLSSSATNLDAGIYIADVVFTNLNDGGWQSRRFILQVKQPLIIMPATGFTSSGEIGGPFNMTSQDFSLLNSGADSLGWSLINTSAWLNASSGGGTLSSNEQTTLTVSLNSTANNLAAGIYTANLFFTNLTRPSAQSRQFTLRVGQPLVQNGGFETGDFTDWTLDGDGFNFNYVDDSSMVTAIAPHSGTYFAALGEVSVLANLSQTLPTVANQPYLLSLWLDSPNVSPFKPNEFSVTWNEKKIFDKVNIARIGWTNLQFIVIATNSGSILKFGALDNNYYLGLDDVSLKPISLPVFQTVTTTNNMFKFTWNAMTGLVYQVQYNTNLLQTNWVNLGSPITATQAMLTATNSIGPDPQRFYRLQVSP